MNILGAAGGYAIAGGLYALLALLLVVSWRGNRLGAVLIFAVVASTGWAVAAGFETARATLSPLLLFILEVIRLGGWLLLLGGLLWEMHFARRLCLAANTGWLLLLAVGLVAGLTGGRIELGANLGELLSVGGLLAVVAGLVLIEQLYRNSPDKLRWRLRFLVFGVGGLFAFDLFLHSQAVMLNAVDRTTWIARGYCNALFVPMIALAARRNPDWTVRIFVSRHVIFYTTALVATGIYLLMMAAGGYFLLRFGGGWGPVVRLAFLLGAGIVLVTLLSSTQMHGRLRVFLSKHFFRDKYDHRREWLRLVSTLANFGDSSTRQVVIRAMAQIVGSPGGVLWIRDPADGTYRLAATLGAEPNLPDIASEDPVIDFMKRDGWLIDLAEYARTQRHYGSLSIPDWLAGIEQAWLVIPMMTRDEFLGLMLLFEAPGPPRLNYEDRDLLKTVASHIGVHLAQERSDRLLLEARQFHAYNRLTAFLMHDLNNLIAQQSLLVSNAEKHKRNPEFVDDAIATIAASVERMESVMKQLRSGTTEVTSHKPADLKFVASAAVDRRSADEPRPLLELNGIDAQLPVNAEQLTMVLVHLIRNAQEATGPDGKVRVSLARNGASATVTVADTGTGMSTEFVRERLFRPFDSTKGSQGMGIGAYQAREFVRSVGGEMKVESAPSRGTTVTMSLPIYAASSATQVQ